MKREKTRTKEKSGVPTAGRKSKRVGLSTLDEHRLRRTLRRKACSETWVDAQIKSVHDSDGDGESILYRFYDPTVFPPGGARGTAMRWCRSCGRYTPAPCIRLVEHHIARGGPVHSSTLECDDCWLGVEAEIFRELHEAGLFLRPTGSMSFVRMRELLRDRLRG